MAHDLYSWWSHELLIRSYSSIEKALVDMLENAWEAGFERVFTLRRSSLDDRSNPDNPIVARCICLPEADDPETRRPKSVRVLFTRQDSNQVAQWTVSYGVVNGQECTIARSIGTPMLIADAEYMLPSERRARGCAESEVTHG